jgi:diguanylate cyclase (GGDEF)-like protein/putative nucleotidyltransferase with HDIG domain
MEETNIPKVYDPQSFEKKWYQYWEENKLFHAEVDETKKPFSIVMPPPNITGQLHMGHALDNTMQDILIRYKRMQGYNALWQPGTDHASIATEVKVIQSLKEKGIDKADLGREGFLEKCWEWMTLTSLYNRKHAFECIDHVCQHQKPSTLIVLDIDDFKLYNELYGAQESDNLIHRFAQVILQEISSKDIGFRFGADEFLILKAGTDIDEACSCCKRIVDAITDATPANTVWDITITCGISVFPDISTDAASFLHNAEQAIYYGKQAGKGNIEVYRPGIDERSHDPDIRAAYERVAPTIYALTAAIDAKDSYTFIHSMNVSKYAVILAEALGMNSNDIEIIRDAGLLHDIGKISIPERILQKTSKLTDEEYAIMKTHVENSTKMIRYLPDMDYVIPAVVGHHERYDGTGYPRGLAGQNIPYMARILTIADCFDAMTAKRPYKQALSVEYAVNELEKNSGTQFDPVLVKKIVELIHEGKISIA